MILIGQFDSPFVRRVAIAMRLYGMAFEHRPWSVFGDADKLSAFNPLKRVPTLVLDDGEVLIESFCILDALDQMVGEGQALIASTGPDRREALKVSSLAVGLADKAVSLVYERAIHDRSTPMWVERCRGQIGGVLDALEADRATRAGDWWFGANIGHADIAVAVALNFLNDAHAGLFDLNKWPRLARHTIRCEALAPFMDLKQAFKVTPPKTAA
jgi:glutathione S-transferase